MNEQLKSYDFGVLTSRQEGLANTIMEYMSVALPCITSNGGAVPELIKNDHNGYLFNYNDEAALTKHLEHCITMTNETYARLSLGSHQVLAD